ncbi:hypothetical protein GH714_017764 [Hevea brasiliensis]|uniref:Uncharacterized protein n=1 Tax=Hevea brasiliensis TaxID=3981 RepID=A0A6A6LPP4_HEVBR|nr:hypothetical protein GH714_017764 [Hevea brasiliensis]
MDASQRQKHRKKSSKTVVIRNVNYITRKRGNGEKASFSDESYSDEDDFTDKDSLQQKVNDAIGSLEKLHKSRSSNHRKKEGEKTNDQWDAFENLLMRDKEATVNGVERLHPMDVPDEHFTVKSLGVGTALANNCAMDLELEKVPKQPMAASDSFVVAQREGEWKNLEMGLGLSYLQLSHPQLSLETEKIDLTLSSQPGNGTVKENHEILGGYEPNDLCVVLEWDSGLESGRESWTSDHGIDISFMETERRSSSIETNNDAAKKLASNCDSTTIKKKESNGRKVPGKDCWSN